MWYLNQEALENVDDLIVYGGKCEDFKDVWGLIDNKFHFFSDFDEVSDKESFTRFYNNFIYDVCVARKDGEIVYASWIVISGWKSFYHCGIGKKEFRNIALTKRLTNIALDYYKSKYDINRFDSLVNADNRASRLCTLRLGFKGLGRIPKLFQVNGIDTDYYKYYLEA